MIRREADKSDAPDTSEAGGEDPHGSAEPVSPAPGGSEEGRGETGLQVVGQVALQILIGLGIVAAGGAATWFLVSQKTAPSRIDETRSAPSVVVQEAEVEDVPTRVEGHGAVRATRELQLFPQVSGRVIETHPGLIAGGTIAAGEVVLRIDPTDYELALEQAQASLERAEAGLKRIDSRRRSAAAEVARERTTLQTVQAEAAVARREFERINPGEPVPPLVAREPQVAEAEAALEAAQAALEDVDAEEDEFHAQAQEARSAVRQAQVNLERTEVRLPEEDTVWRVTSESVDVGQTVAPGAAVASLFDTASLEVPVPLEDRQLQWIDLGADGDGSPATITTDFAGTGRSWPGRVTRTGGQINPRTRLVEVIVTVQGAAREATAAPGTAGVVLVPGLFVDVVIEGAVMEDVTPLPRRAVHSGEADGAPRVHVARNGHLHIQPVEVIRRSGDTMYVRGLSDGDLIILTRLEIVSEGMAVQVGMGAAEGAAARTDDLID